MSVTAPFKALHCREGEFAQSHTNGGDGKCSMQRWTFSAFLSIYLSEDLAFLFPVSLFTSQSHCSVCSVVFV